MFPGERRSAGRWGTAAPRGPALSKISLPTHAQVERVLGVDGVMLVAGGELAAVVDAVALDGGPARRGAPESWPWAPMIMQIELWSLVMSFPLKTTSSPSTTGPGLAGVWRPFEVEVAHRDAAGVLVHDEAGR